MTEISAAERGHAMLDEIERIENTFGRDRAGWPAGQRERADRLEAGVRRLEGDDTQ